MKLVSEILLFIARIVPMGYWRIIRFAAARDSALWNYPIKINCCPGRELRADLRESVYTGMFRTGSIPHQLGFEKMLQRTIEKEDVVYDVGANIGYTSMLFSTLVGENGLVVSLEPVPRAFDLLERTCKDYSNIKCLNIAASREAGDLNLYVSDMLDRSSAISSEGGRLVSVKAEPLDSLSDKFGNPDFVKIDVEGFEESVIMGMKKILGSKRSPVVIFEALSNSCRVSCRELIEKNALIHYDFFRVGNKAELRSFDDDFGSSDYIAIPEWAMTRFKQKNYL
jgi:FkbM family methyltransferase